MTRFEVFVMFSISNYLLVRLLGTTAQTRVRVGRLVMGPFGVNISSVCQNTVISI